MATVVRALLSIAVVVALTAGCAHSRATQPSASPGNNAQDCSSGSCQ